VRGSAAKAVNKDTKAIMLSDNAIMRSIPALSVSDLGEDFADEAESDEPVADMSAPAKPSRKGSSGAASRVSDVRGVLDNYVVTSHAPTRAIISGAGGTRVVFNGEETVLGGVLWRVAIRPSAVEFEHEDQKVLLLFDRSLSPPSSSGASVVPSAAPVAASAPTTSSSTSSAPTTESTSPSSSSTSATTP
jgi:hypothetical protein